MRRGQYAANVSLFPENGFQGSAYRGSGLRILIGSNCRGSGFRIFRGSNLYVLTENGFQGSAYIRIKGSAATQTSASVEGSEGTSRMASSSPLRLRRKKQRGNAGYQAKRDQLHAMAYQQRQTAAACEVNAASRTSANRMTFTFTRVLKAPRLTANRQSTRYSATEIREAPDPAELQGRAPLGGHTTRRARSGLSAICFGFHYCPFRALRTG